MTKPAVIGLFEASEYSAYLQTPHWQQMRQVALQRAGRRCQVCSSKRDLQVHHNDYSRKGSESIYDLVVLCDGCHGRLHGKGANR